VQVLVASDAIGMGVNLNVRRIIFHSLRTFNPANGGLQSLDPSHIKQIAGVSSSFTLPPSLLQDA
jgi:ATP-dependent RNA helicase SUPV3L1/SUV3